MLFFVDWESAGWRLSFKIKRIKKQEYFIYEKRPTNFGRIAKVLTRIDKNWQELARIDKNWQELTRIDKKKIEMTIPIL